MYCFIVSQFFCLVRPMRCFKLGSKSRSLYIRWTSYPRAIIILSIKEGIFYVYISLHIHYQLSGVLNS